MTWTKDGMPFLFQEFEDSVRMIEGGLMFTEASDDFSGDYVCTATSEGVGMAVSPSANVKVLCELLRLALMQG